MPVLFCSLPLPIIALKRCHAANDDGLQHPATASNVRLLRRAQDMDSSRFVMSGKLADVCQALERLASEEVRHASH